MLTVILCKTPPNVPLDGGRLKQDLRQCMNKFIGGVGVGSHDWDDLCVPKRFLQAFRSTGHVSDLGASGVESDNLR